VAHRTSLILGFFISLTLDVGPARGDTPVLEIAADPAAVRLDGPQAKYSILLNGKKPDGQLVDLTADAGYRSLDSTIAQVSNTGVVQSVGDGATAVIIKAAGRELTIPVRVTGSKRPTHLNFANDVIPLLSRFGCNSSACHGKAEGQNGFKLSVFGFDPVGDYAALTKESRGRRVFAAAPEHSLLLAKVSGAVAHGGGLRMPRGTSAYETLRSWIATGVPFGEASDPKVEKIRVEPAERLLVMGGRQQLRVVARYSDDREVDVTALARFQSNSEGLASASTTGLVTAGQAPGDVAVMASFMNAVAVFRAIIPRAEAAADFPQVPANNFIDELVFRKLRKLNLVPSDLADDAEYLRRTYLNVIGTLPTSEEARRFLKDKSPGRRARLVDELLGRPEYADYWALKWADMLRVDREALGHKGAYAYYRWIRDSLSANKPLDQFAREILTAEGPLNQVGPANFYKVVNRPGDEASTLVQVFLGVRIACAQCHHHPFDRWSQSDYYGMEAYFTPVSCGGSPQGEMLKAQGDLMARNPRSGEMVYAHALGAGLPDQLAKGDGRGELARWMTAPSNPWFARNLANHVWAHFLGRGLVEPVDDARATNPPTNPELLDRLAQFLVENRFDVRQLIRLITASRVYQLSSRPNRTNERDEQNYSRALFKRIDAEVLLDMVCQTTGIGEKFPGVPAGYRAIQLWDSKVPHYFLKLFGRPVRASACACERNHEPSVSQVLHLLNAPEIHDKLTHEGGSIARLVRKGVSDADLVDELFLTFYSRFATDSERAVALEYLRKEPSQRRQAAEDLAWSMLNSLEFMFNH
jgi:hypothetical protein